MSLNGGTNSDRRPLNRAHRPCLLRAKRLLDRVFTFIQTGLCGEVTKAIMAGTNSVSTHRRLVALLVSTGVVYEIPVT